MKKYWAVGVEINVFVTSALDGGEWSAALPPGKQLPVPIA
jgi:hypothetical protein